MKKIKVVGAGLAGAEAAWQIARLGLGCELLDIKPGQMTAAHSSIYPAELVCSNSLKSDDPQTASGLLKREMRQLDSIIMSAADATRVPAGSALAVDREAFARRVDALLDSTGLIRRREQEIADLDVAADCLMILATGPLTTDKLMAAMAREWGDMLYFFDAAAPIVSADSLDPEHYFFASRYGKGSADYLNCPLDRDLYLKFRAALLAADKVPVRDFDRKVFQDCQPLEILAERGEDTMRFGPLKPVGLIDPRTGEVPYAVLQLRREQSSGEMYNLVGCQTRLTFSAQREVFGLIPALREAEYLRFGVMHRNHYIHGPKVLAVGNKVRSRENLFLAGQITGVEGYLESAASGLITARLVALVAAGLPVDCLSSLTLPPTTMMGALANYVTTSDSKDFQPMNANFGILCYDPDFVTARRKRERREQVMPMSDHHLAIWRDKYLKLCQDYGLCS
ncbi:MAG TPA: methylenetetrahydrofolate--tRNA-(uracil(54)-C(5))-methyltransferase (FADH(2)-oxidizing) TrmFO [Clostridiaceae bacterium]|nr:methylenetetrahydrofolate--tRNA-(uracil(54)-C(5))-methyltransferase (FADH(2)-oxidizing) TrmFO [Clostridiaceae bacterium]